MSWTLRPIGTEIIRSGQVADGEIIIETNDNDRRSTFLSGLQSGSNLSWGIAFCSENN